MKFGPVKPTLMAAGAGGIAGVAVTKILPMLPASIQQSPWAAPALLILGGHLLKKKKHDMGMAIVGVGGAFLATAILAHTAAPRPQAQGFDDFAALQESAALQGAGDFTEGFADAAALLGEGDTMGGFADAAADYENVMALNDG